MTETRRDSTSRIEFKRRVVAAYRRTGCLRGAAAATGITYVRVWQIMREEGEWMHPSGGAPRNVK